MIFDLKPWDDATLSYLFYLAALVRLTLPLSGRQEACGGAAENIGLPVHSRGLFEVQAPYHNPEILTLELTSASALSINIFFALIGHKT